MTDFADVEQFGREHSACGGISPSAAPQTGGGFELSLVCTCGATLRRAVTVEEAKRPLPLPRAARSAPRPPAPPSADMEAAIRAAVQAEEAPPPPAPATGPHAAPARLNLDTTIRTALTHQSALKKQTATMQTAAGRRAAPRTRVAWLLLFAIVSFGGAGAVYFAGTLDTPEPAPVASAPAAPSPPLDRQQRAALAEIVSSLRQLQAASSPSASLSVYASRVGFAKADADRLIGSTAAGPERTLIREVVDIHLLAATAWRARTLDQKDSWEALGQDAAVDLCPSVKRVVDFATQPANVSRAQARGVAVASAIPLLWECAGAKIASIDRAPAAE